MVIGLSADIHRPFRGPGPREAERRTVNEMGGLYPSLADGKQKLEKRADALRPGILVVLAAFDALVLQVAAELPALAEQDVAEPLHIVDNSRTFAGANVQPHARERTNWSCGGEA